MIAYGHLREVDNAVAGQVAPGSYKLTLLHNVPAELAVMKPVVFTEYRAARPPPPLDKIRPLLVEDTVRI